MHSNVWTAPTVGRRDEDGDGNRHDGIESKARGPWAYALGCARALAHAGNRSVGLVRREPDVRLHRRLAQPHNAAVICYDINFGVGPGSR